MATLNLCGPQHTQLTFGMADAYRRLFLSARKAFPHQKLMRVFPVCGSRYKEKIQLSRLTPFEGEEFPKTDEECMRYYEPAVRLMVVGEFEVGKSELCEKTAEEFLKSAGDSICETGIRFRYSIGDEAFPHDIRKIAESLKPTALLDELWYEHILWYNPFVFPETETDRIGLELCRELLCLNIEFYSPTHILFWGKGKAFEQEFAGIRQIFL